MNNITSLSQTQTLNNTKTQIFLSLHHKKKSKLYFCLMKSKIHHQPNGSNNGVVSSNDNGCRSESPSPPLSPNRRVLRRQRRQTLLRASSFSLRRNLRYLLLLPMIYASGLLMCVGPFSGLVGWVYVPGSVYRSPEIYRKLKDDIFSDNSTALEVRCLLFFLSFVVKFPLLCQLFKLLDVWFQLSSVWKFKRRPKMPKPCPNSTVSSHFGLNRGKIVSDTELFEFYGFPVSWIVHMILGINVFDEIFSESSALAPSSGYLIVEANGGLNQQRSAVSSSCSLIDLFA